MHAPRPDLLTSSPELALLLDCARYRFDCAAVEPITGPLLAAIDPTWLVELACRHSLLRATYAALQANGPAGVPDSLLGHLQQELQASTARSLQLTAELQRLLNLFAAQEILVVPFKGPTLSALLYGNAALRPCKDLDLLVHEADVARASALLVAEGYRPFSRRYACEHHFYRADGRLLVDLHWGFGNTHLPVPLGLEDVCGRLAAVAVNRSQVFTLGGEDTLLVLCVNAAKDDWASLGRLYEIGLCAQLPGMSWAGLLETATSSGCERVLLAALSLTHALYAAPLPPEVLARTRAPAPQRLAAEALQLLLGEAPGQGVGELGLRAALFLTRLPSAIRAGLWRGQHSRSARDRRDTG